MERITETDAARNLADVLDRVREEGAAFDIVRDGEVVARIVPAERKSKFTVSDFIELFGRLPRLDPEDAEAFEADLAAIRKEFPAQDRKWD